MLKIQRIIDLCVSVLSFFEFKQVQIDDLMKHEEALADFEYKWSQMTIEQQIDWTYLYINHLLNKKNLRVYGQLIINMLHQLNDLVTEKNIRDIKNKTKQEK